MVHSCSVEDARLLALRENSKARLPLTKAERMDAAWQLVCLNHPEYSKKVIRETTGVGDGTVANMRRTRKALLERGTDPDFLPAHWWQALAELKHQSRRELTDDEREEMIEAKAAQLDAKIGNDLGFMAAHQIEAACIVVAKRLGKQGMSYLIDEHWEDEDLSDFPF